MNTAIIESELEKTGRGHAEAMFDEEDEQRRNEPSAPGNSEFNTAGYTGATTKPAAASESGDAAEDALPLYLAICEAVVSPESPLATTFRYLAPSRDAEGSDVVHQRGKDLITRTVQVVPSAVHAAMVRGLLARG